MVKTQGMKKTKNVLLGTALTGALLLSTGFGTYSWFTSESNAQAEMKNGILQINNGGNMDTPIFTAEQFAPSQLHYGEFLSISNTGDMDAHIQATYTHSIDKASLEGYEVGYFAMKYTVKPDKDVYEDSKIELDNLFNGTTNEVLSIGKDSNSGIEMISSLLSADQVKSGEILLGDGENEEFWQLDEGQYIDIMMAVKLDDSAGNEYQGASYKAGLHVIAKQTDAGSTYTNKSDKKQEDDK
ncbi:hypothetical protein [Sporosarcina sp. A2]|uniref:hypothetical protein n=1 Tax=Sporosarcina sp. A2 TaxID=3393449 RepID=UPI003D7AD46E